MTDVGRCSKCGALCHHCAPRDSYSLTALPESVRDKVREVLDEIEASQAAQDSLVRDICHFEARHIERAYRIWNLRGLKFSVHSWKYFAAIVRNCARQSEHEAKILDDPPEVWE